ncbi:recombinase family protein [Sphingobium sp. PNB]|uniref:recombinase family protein n=1 Tax=Sphingobium sp. PNB TaxID=863934 RepID=UPI001CA3E8A1|nr:recombinase family protein [Sphingobium sp. PNB]MCB4862720.1 recombinase family protein [Sphingobium sp. PNB]
MCRKLHSILLKFKDNICVIHKYKFSSSNYGNIITMIVGYARANAASDLPVFVEILRKAGCVEVITDCAGGNTTERPGLNRALAMLGPGDTLMVPDVCRLARGLEALASIEAELDRRAIKLAFIDDGVELNFKCRLLFQRI